MALTPTPLFADISLSGESKVQRPHRCVPDFAQEVLLARPVQFRHALAFFVDRQTRSERYHHCGEPGVHITRMDYASEFTTNTHSAGEFGNGILSITVGRDTYSL